MACRRLRFTGHTLAAAGRPLARGEFAVLYASGLGAVSMRRMATQRPCRRWRGRWPTCACVGRAPCEVQFAPWRPGFAGVYQVNFACGSAAAGSQEIVVSATQSRPIGARRRAGRCRVRQAGSRAAAASRARTSPVCLRWRFQDQQAATSGPGCSLPYIGAVHVNVYRLFSSLLLAPSTSRSRHAELLNDQSVRAIAGTYAIIALWPGLLASVQSGRLSDELRALQEAARLTTGRLKSNLVVRSGHAAARTDRSAFRGRLREVDGGKRRGRKGDTRSQCTAPIVGRLAACGPAGSRPVDLGTASRSTPDFGRAAAGSRRESASLRTRHYRTSGAHPIGRDCVGAHHDLCEPAAAFRHAEFTWSRRRIRAPGRRLHLARRAANVTRTSANALASGDTALRRHRRASYRAQTRRIEEGELAPRQRTAGGRQRVVLVNLIACTPSVVVDPAAPPPRARRQGAGLPVARDDTAADPVRQRVTEPENSPAPARFTLLTAYTGAGFSTERHAAPTPAAEAGSRSPGLRRRRPPAANAVASTGHQAAAKWRVDHRGRGEPRRARRRCGTDSAPGIGDVHSPLSSPKVCTEPRRQSRRYSNLPPWLDAPDPPAAIVA